VCRRRIRRRVGSHWPVCTVREHVGPDDSTTADAKVHSYYIFCPSSALVTCPFAMTDGAARLLSRHLAPPRSVPQTQALDFTAVTLTEDEREAETSRRVFKRAYNRLTSRFPNIRWTNGQWMTERPGGLDGARTETTAVYRPFSGPMAERPEQEMGPWVVNGHKFFSSATDSDMAIFLARTEGNKRLSAFYAPMRMPNGDSNGVRITRLKPKMGTRALPSAEIELKGMRAWLIGHEGDGIREISTILGVTRVHNSICAVSFMRRALSVAKVRCSRFSTSIPPPLLSVLRSDRRHTRRSSRHLVGASCARRLCTFARSPRWSC